jgi:ABC-type antimicrobial peptide transport system permease subunit
MLIINASNLTLIEGIRTSVVANPITMLIVVVASAITSVLAGIIPAIIAARKQPIDALKQ